MSKNRLRTHSLYLTLGIIIITTVTLTMSINATYNYINQKNKIVENIKDNSKTTILSLEESISNFISSYAINEYEKLISNVIEKKDIFAIIIEDYKMGEILSQKAYITGKIRDKNLQIIDYKYDNSSHNKSLKNCFYSSSFTIKNGKNEPLGTISIYITDKKINEELNSTIYNTLINTVVISFLLIILLFIPIKIFILKPIYAIIKGIKNSDKDGIPIGEVPNSGSIEINALSKSMNTMINSIKSSRLARKKNAHRLEYLLEMSPIAVRIAKDKGENVIFANNAYSKLLRQKKNTTKGRNPRDYYANSSIYDEVVTALKNDQTIYNRLVELSIQGDTIWALASYMNIRFDGEDAIIGWFYDVTKEKENEKSLFNALELQTAIFDNSGYILIRTDKDGIITQINKEVQNLLGYKAEELVDLHNPEILHLDSEIIHRTELFEKELNCKINTKFETFVIKTNLGLQNEHEWTYISKDGKNIPVLLTVTALKDNENKIYGYLGIAQDISQRKLMQSQAKLASMGEMIGNIAHQWRQPLSVISTIASGIKLRSEFKEMEKPELLDNMDKIVEQSNYLSKTIDDFRNFIKNKNKKENIPISNIINKSISIVSASLNDNNIKLIKNIDTTLNINAYENQLIQAFINIFNNAKDVLKDKNKEDRFIFVKTEKIENSLILTIKDSGGGISNDILQKIFDPYFTTKHKSVGTGIGLSMAYQIIVEHHKATIEVFNRIYKYENKEYQGAEFKIIFMI